MTSQLLLYRSPNVAIDRHEWHARVVCDRKGHTILRFYWRPYAAPLSAGWRPMLHWTGPKPKGFRRFFARYELSIADARKSAAKASAVPSKLAA